MKIVDIAVKKSIASTARIARVDLRLIAANLRTSEGK